MLTSLRCIVMLSTDDTEQQQPGVPGVRTGRSVGAVDNAQYPEQPVGVRVSQPVAGVHAGAHVGETQLHRPHGRRHCVSTDVTGHREIFLST